MKLVPLEIGRLDTQLKAVTGDPGSKSLPIPAWLVEHPEGLLLFDTGMHTDLQSGTERIGEYVAAIFSPDFPKGEELTARLAQHNVRPSDIDRVIFSHLHFDHAGGTVEIPDARVLVQATEWEAGQNSKLIDAGVYNPNDYQHGHDVELLHGQHDVFGDGKVVCIPTPGHTPGHQSLRLELEDTGPVVLTADCVYYEQLLTDMVAPPLGGDAERQLQSMRELKALRDDHGCQLLFGHDEEQFRSLPTEGLT